MLSAWLLKMRNSLAFYIEICIKNKTKQTNKNKQKWQLALASWIIDQILQSRVQQSKEIPWSLWDFTANKYDKNKKWLK